jgi:putative Holliday junction resolvase
MMTKYLGIDFGSKKVGFAQSDDEGRLAFPLMISDNDKMLLKDTLELIREMKFSTVVIGESVDQNGKPNAIAKEARKFGMEIENAIDVKVVFEKEWYSTVEARKQPGNEGNHNVDDRAAAIVLQRYLDKVNGPVRGGDTCEYESEDEDGGEETNNDNW